MTSFRLSRRAVLRGAGSIAIALPWLEIMREERPAHAAGVPARRFIGVYTPGGTVHEFDAGTHIPEQVPPLHTFVQALPVFCQVPVASQVCGWSALHCFDAGTHDPVHAPLLQTFAQAVPAFCQVPVASHFCG